MNSTTVSAKNLCLTIARYCLATAATAAIANTFNTSHIWGQRGLGFELERFLELAVFDSLWLSSLFYLGGEILPAPKQKPSFNFEACEWRIEKRPGIPSREEYCQWFVTRLEKEVLDDDEGQEPLVLRKLACDGDRCTSFLVSEDDIDDYLLWEFFEVEDRRGLDGKVFVSQEVSDGIEAVRKLVAHLHREHECRNLS